MAKKIKEILLAKGYTAEEIAAMGTMIDNPRFASALEEELAQIDVLQTETDRLTKELNGDTEWYQNTVVPKTNALIQEAAEAKAQAAAANARLKSLQDAGLIKVMDGNTGGGDGGGNPNPNPAPKPDNQSGIDTSKFATVDYINSASGEIRTTTIDLNDMAEEHVELFGKRLPGGRQGLVKAYTDAQATKRYRGTLRQFWEDTYKVADKRSELEANAKKLDRDNLEKEIRTQVASEYANPSTRPLINSRSPFTNRVVTTDTNGKPANIRPWEKSAEQRQSERVSKFATKISQTS